jgi:hypothetical protein
MGLDRIDALTVTIRDDHFHMREATLTDGGPTREEIQAQLWAPYRFMIATVPDHGRADDIGRTTVYDAALPIGEEIPYYLERTRPPTWGIRHDSGSADRPARTSHPARTGSPAQGTREMDTALRIDLGVDHDPNSVGWLVDVPQQ